MSGQKFHDRVVNYAQTVREHVGTMRASAWQCTQCHDYHELPRIVHKQLTSSSRVVHNMFTSSSRTVQEQFMTNARQLRSVRGYIQGFLDTAGHSRDRQWGDNLNHRDNMPLQESRRNGTTCHDKIVAKSRASVSLALYAKDFKLFSKWEFKSRSI